MEKQKQSGFTLIELLLVCVIIGLVATVAVPSFMKAKDAAESASAVTTLRNMHSTQMLYKFPAGRFARLTELNAFSSNTLGRTLGTTLRRREFIYVMLPSPTNESLKNDFQIIGYRIQNGRVISQYHIDETGFITTVLP